MNVKTQLRAEMLVLVGAMGRDIAAFTDPAAALRYAISIDRLNHGTHITYRRPDGDTKRLCDFGDTRNEPEFTAWATAGAEAE